MTLPLKIEPCPFCGGEARTIISYQWRWVQVRCSECGASITVQIYPKGVKDPEEDDASVIIGAIDTALENWNRRE